MKKFRRVNIKRKERKMIMITPQEITFIYLFGGFAILIYSINSRLAFGYLVYVLVISSIWILIKNFINKKMIESKLTEFMKEKAISINKGVLIILLIIAWICGFIWERIYLKIAS